MRISTIRCIDLFSNRERLRREEKKAYGGYFFISYSRQSSSSIFSIFKPFIFGKPSESLYRRSKAFIKPFFRIIFLIRKKKERITKTDRKGQQIIFIDFSLLSITRLITTCAVSLVIPMKPNRRKRLITLRTMKTGTFLNPSKPHFFSHRRRHLFPT